MTRPSRNVPLAPNEIGYDLKPKLPGLGLVDWTPKMDVDLVKNFLKLHENQEAKRRVAVQTGKPAGTYVQAPEGFWEPPAGHGDAHQEKPGLQPADSNAAVGAVPASVSRNETQGAPQEGPKSERRRNDDDDDDDDENDPSSSKRAKDSSWDKKLDIRVGMMDKLFVNHDAYMERIEAEAAIKEEADQRILKDECLTAAGKVNFSVVIAANAELAKRYIMNEENNWRYELSRLWMEPVLEEV